MIRPLLLFFNCSHTCRLLFVCWTLMYDIWSGRWWWWYVECFGHKGTSCADLANCRGASFLGKANCEDSQNGRQIPFRLINLFVAGRFCFVSLRLLQFTLVLVFTILGLSTLLRIYRTWHFFEEFHNRFFFFYPGTKVYHCLDGKRGNLMRILDYCIMLRTNVIVYSKLCLEYSLWNIINLFSSGNYTIKTMIV